MRFFSSEPPQNLGTGLDYSDSPLSAEAALRGAWKYSSEYATIIGEGHSRPPPEFGTPTLVWHLAIWPAYGLDTPHSSGENDHADPEAFDAQNSQFFWEISEFLRDLQMKGRILDPEEDMIKGFEFRRPSFMEAASDLTDVSAHTFKVCDPQAIAFTLWWQERAGAGIINERQLAPEREDLRVRVQAQSHVDHVTLSFFIDVGKAWNCPPVFDSAHAAGRRRKAIFDRLERSNAICQAQISGGYIDYERVPERGVSSEDAGLLLETAQDLYETVWEDFLDAFGLRVADGVIAIPATADGSREAHGEIFANFRGLIISIDGLATALEAQRQEAIQNVRRRAGIPPLPGDVPGLNGSTGVGSFTTFDPKSGEPNTILKAYWPFIRRMMPNADERDFIACGLRGWRVIYVTALGSPVETIGRDEDSGLNDPPHLPEARSGAHPIRYLFMVKSDPHRDQIGRLVERINALGTMRLFALKNWYVIRNAYIHIRLLGHRLDGLLEHWSRRRHDINQRLHPMAEGAGMPKMAEIEAGHMRANELNRLIEEVQPRLINIGAQLDTIGKGGSGRLLYAINRSKYFMSEFERMTETLDIGHIESWTNYRQFVERGLQPTFDLIRSTGDRFMSLRNRVQALTEIIQTNALIVEADATRENTGILSKIAGSWIISQDSPATFFRIAIAGPLIVLAIEKLIDHWTDVQKIIQILLNFLLTHLPSGQ